MKRKSLFLGLMFAVLLANFAVAQTYPELLTVPIDTVKRSLVSAASASTTQNLASVPNSITIDKTRAVGEIPFTSGVSPSGSTTVNVPIEVYPGIHGMQPQLSLAYNHQAGNGQVGIGWSLSGLSSINRTNKSIYYDSETRGILNNRTDAFVLDGVRLIVLTETADSINYESEQGLIKATAMLTGNVVKYFKVYYPSGQNAVYGYTNNTVDRLQYPLTVLSDLYGNKVTYAYTFASNRYFPTKISYASGQIDFRYVARPDTINYYNAGLKIREDRLLQAIDCKVESTLLRTYTLTYSLNKNTSVLTEIGLSASNVSLNPLKFYYGEGKAEGNLVKKGETALLRYYDGKPEQLKIVTGKIEYGSRDDGVIVTVAKNPYEYHYVQPGPFSHSQSYFQNKYDGTESIFLYSGVTESYSYPPEVATEAGFIDIMCANLDGIYEDEVIKINNVVDGNSDKVTFTVYKPAWIAGFYKAYTRTFKFSTVHRDYSDNRSITPKFYYTGDFNGDGKSEVFAVSCLNPFGVSQASVCYLFDLNSNKKLFEKEVLSFTKAFVGNNSYELENNSDRIFVVDYNGDGKSDICHVNDKGVDFYEFTVSGSTWSMQKTASYTGLKRAHYADRVLMAGEFNGDGKIDFLLSPYFFGNNIWTVFYGTGNGSFTKATCQSAPYVRDYSAYTDEILSHFYIQDLNGDGISDLVEHYTESSYFTGNKTDHEAGIYTYIVKNGLLPDVPDKSKRITVPSKTAVVPINICNKEYYYQFLCLNQGKMSRYEYPYNDTKEKLLTGTISSMGIVNKFYYNMLTDNGYSNYYYPGNDATFPYENFKGPLYVATKQEQYFNGKKQESVAYRYHNAVIHKQGLGFRGFQSFYSYDEIRSKDQMQTFNPYKYSVLMEEISSTAKTTYTNSVSVAANKIVKIRRTASVSDDLLKGYSISTAYSYDTYGNPTKITVNYGDGIAETVSTSYFNNTSLNSYLLGFQTDRTIATTRAGATWKNREYVTLHDSLGSPKSKNIYANGNIVSTEDYTYDAKGNCTKTVLKNYSSPVAFTTTYAYDGYGRLIKETNPLKQATSYTYNKTGQLATEKTPLNYVTTYAYDELGRKKSATGSDGVVSTTELSWTAGGTNGIYCAVSSATNNPTTKTYYDAFGRETRSSTVQFSGLESKTDKKYDAYGRLQSVSLPFTGTSAAKWNTYEYDWYDRPTAIKEASGKITSWSYNKQNVTTQKDGIVSTQYLDVQGKLVKVADLAGEIVYTLRPDGQPSAIVAPGNVKTSFVYDKWGRRTQIIDPSAGTQTYTFDAAGNILTEKDANGKTTTFAYDTLNRQIKKTYPEFTTDYVYNTKGQMTSETSTNGTAKAYTYDTYGRLLTEKETVPDGKFLKKTYTYSNGNISSIAYANQNGNITAENYTYTNGYLTEITVDSKSVWKLGEVTAFGTPKKVTTGGIARTYNYDAYGYPTSRVAGSFFSQTYSFNPATANLNYRKDNKKNIQENFAYDELNRLIGYKDQTADYDIKGNIIQKSDVGSEFFYAIAKKPYALSGVQTSSDAIPLRNQSITYTSFKRPASITENGYNANFTYNGSGARVKMELKKDGQKELNRYYLSENYEIDDKNDGSLKEKLYLGGDFYSASAVYVKENSGNWQIYYIYRDYLGSIMHVTNSSGAVSESLSYDAWGRLRNPSNQQVYATDTEPTLFLGRGYTGHEHLPWFGLVNMNARLYDPVVGRFLSPDPYVQAPEFSQNFNRYSYALNNPLKYTDPDGEFLHLIFGAIIGGIVNWAVHGCEFNAKGLGYFGVGAVAGALGAGIGAGISSAMAGGSFSAGFVGSTAAKTVASSFISGAAIGGGAGAASGFTTGFGNALVEGQSLKNALGQGGIYGLLGGAGGALIGGLVGGIDAGIHGRDFWDGFDYQKALDNIVMKEGLNRSDADWLVANKKNIRMINKSYKMNLKASRTMIEWSDGTSKYGVTMSNKHNTTPTSLITRDAIRGKTDFVLTDIVRHEGTHQLQYLSGYATNMKQMEFGAYFTNMINPATSTTASRVLSILVNDWGLYESDFPFWESLINYFQYGQISF